MALATGNQGSIQAFKDAGYDLDLLECGAALWLMTCFMNHDNQANTNKTQIGSMNFVTAAVRMKAGTELVCRYEKQEHLHTWNI
jgi:hypothetical protein